MWWFLFRAKELLEVVSSFSPRSKTRQRVTPRRADAILITLLGCYMKRCFGHLLVSKLHSRLLFHLIPLSVFRVVGDRIISYPYTTIGGCIVGLDVY
jgi:hypothetical protein